MSEQEDQIVQLPDTYKEFRDKMWPGGTWKKRYEELSDEEKMIHQYCCPAIENGRPIGKAMVVMSGHTEQGKSTTIQSFFNDQIYPRMPEGKTLELAQYGKNLNVKVTNPVVCKLRASISFVDMPGSCDTEPLRQQANFAKIKRFRSFHPDLQAPETGSAEVIAKTFYNFVPRKEVYPNLVLFVYRANNERMEGENSSLRKSLKDLGASGLVDLEFINMMVIVTEAMYIEDGFKYKSEDIESTIQKAVQQIIGIQRVSVVFIENKPKDKQTGQRLSYENAFYYKLPNGNSNYANLQEKMAEILDSNNDILGKLLTSWYLHPDCPDKCTADNKAVAQNRDFFSSLIQPDANGLIEAVNQLAELRIWTGDVSSTAPINFSVLGRGFCAKSEQTKNFNLLFRHEHKATMVVSTLRMIPKCLSVNNNTERLSTTFCFHSKEEFNEHRKDALKLGLDVKLVTSMAVSGSWSTDTNRSEKKSVMIVRAELRLAKLLIENIDEYLTEKLKEELAKLPDENYDDAKHGARLNQFLGKWGSHVVSELYLGGSMEICGEVNETTTNNTEIRKLKAEIEATIKVIFKPKLEAGDVEQLSNKLESKLSRTTIKFTGGNPPQGMTLDNLSPDVFMSWLESVQGNPAELRHELGLVPYFDFVTQTHLTLRKATLAYLSHDPTPATQANRENLQRRASETFTVAQLPRTPPSSSRGPDCFPGEVQVLTTNDVVWMHDLARRKHDKRVLITATPTSKYKGTLIKETTFFTFLHVDRHSTCEFIVICCENGRSLPVTPHHLVFVCSLGNQRISAIPANLVQIGDCLVTVDPVQNQKPMVSKAKVVRIGRSFQVGIYAPLTQHGTVVVNGFLASCYASIDSHRLAHLAMAPLLLWHKLLILRCPPRNHEATKSENGVPTFPTGIHKYALSLMKLTNSFGTLQIKHN